MAPAALLSPAGTVQSFCSASSMKKWQPKKLVSSRSALIRSSSSQAIVEKASLLSSSTSRKPLDSSCVFGRGRRSGLRADTRGCSSRPVFAAAVEGSIAIQESSSASVEAGENSEETTAGSAPGAQEGTAPSTPSPVKAERFKPRVPGQKARREDPSVPAEALVEGAVFTGTVTTIQSFGAFVNFGAFTDGLVHISKLSTGYVSNVSDIVTLGQEVKVTILNVEQSSGRIALSMVEKEEREAREAALAARAAAPRTGEAREGGERSRFQQGPDGKPVNRGRIAGGGRSTRRDDPQKPPTKLVKGQEVEGTVKNKIRSGVFVTLANDEEGFLRYSDIPGGDNMAPESSLQSGEKIKATVLKIERGKINLTMKPIVDITSVNRIINKGEVSSANPFEIAFRALNLIPKEEDVPAAAAVEEAPAVEEVIPEAAAAVEEAPAVEEVIPEAASSGEEAPAVEEVIPEAAASVEEAPAVEEVIPEVAAAVEEAPAVEEVVPEVAAAVEEAPAVEEVVPEVTAAVAEAPAVEEVVPEVAAAVEEAPAVEEVVPEVAAAVEEAPAVEEAIPEVAASVEQAPPAEEVVPQVAAAEEESPAVEEVLPEASAAVEEAPAVEEVVPQASAAVEEAPAVEEVVPEASASVEEAPAEEEEVQEVAAAIEAALDVEEVMPEAIAAIDEMLSAEEESVQETKTAVEEVPPVKEEVVPETIAKLAAVVEEAPAPEVAAEESPAAEDPVPETNAAVNEPPMVAGDVPEAIPQIAGAIEEAIVAVENMISQVSAAIEESPVAEATPDLTPGVEAAPFATEDVIPKASAAPLVEEDPVEKKPAGVSAALVKQLRDETGAGMMDCKRALKDTGGDIEKARESLRKKGLASAEKKASRVASEGLVGSYVHDSRIGVLVEVNCETDFVSRGPAFKSLVEDVGMQVVASQQVQFVSVDDIPSEFVTKEKELEAQREDLRSKPEAIRGKIVEGRVSKRLNEIALLEQPYIRDDNILVKDLVKQTVATLGENIKVRRFERYVLGEGLQKKGTDFAAEVAAQTAVKEPVEAPKVEETPAPAPTDTVVSAALVKELRAQTGAGMMDCKKALTATENDLEKAVEYLRKKGLASADKKSSRLASEGLIGTYIHDGRIGILIEVNCETDFVARGEKFKELVEDLAMQAAAYPLVQVVSTDDVPPEVVAKEKELESGKEDLANKPEAIRARIVDGRVAKRLAELSLLEQPFIKDDKKLVKDIVKETVASLGENIQVRRFTRFNLGEGIAKRVVDFASEVAAQTGVKA